MLRNIEGILSQSFEGAFEILVGDNSVNASNAEILKQGITTLEKFHKIDISLSVFPENHGYSKGNNLLAEKAKGAYLCVLNPDIEWDDRDTLSHLISHIKQDSDIGIIAPRQKERTGKEALCIRSFPSLCTQVARRTFLRYIPFISHIVQKDEMLHVSRETTQQVDWVQSSFLIIGKNLWESLGGFDETYFLFLADTQLCKDVWQSGKSVVYYADTIVYSDGIRCSEGGFLSVFTSRTLRIHICDSVRYFLRQMRK